MLAEHVRGPRFSLQCWRRDFRRWGLGERTRGRNLKLPRAGTLRESQISQATADCHSTPCLSGFIYYYYCMCVWGVCIYVCGHAHATSCDSRSTDNIRASVLSFHHGFWGWTRVIRFAWQTFLNRLTGPQTLSFDPELQVFQAWILLIFTHEHCKTPAKNPSWRKSASILASSWALQMFSPPTWPGIWSKITELSGHQMVPQGHTETAGNSDRLARTADIEDSRKRASARDSSLSTRRQDSSLEVLAGTTK